MTNKQICQSNQDQNLIKVLKEFSYGTISYNKVYAKICDYEPVHALVLSQLTYWSTLMDGEEFYKTDAELMEECGIRKERFRSAKKQLADLGFITVTVKGVPAKTYYQVNQGAILEAILNLDDSVPSPSGGTFPQTSMRKTRKLAETLDSSVCVKHANWNAGNTQTIIRNIEYTENTYKKPSSKVQKKEVEKNERKKRATCLPDDFDVPIEWINWATSEEGMDKEFADSTAKKFVNYWVGEGKPKKDWFMTWKNWVLSERERKPEKFKSIYQPSTPTPSSAPQVALEEKVRAGTDKRVCDFIKGKYGQTEFTTWIERRGVWFEAEGNRVTMHAPSRFIADSISAKFLSGLREIGLTFKETAVFDPAKPTTGKPKTPYVNGITLKIRKLLEQQAPKVYTYLVENNIMFDETERPGILKMLNCDASASDRLFNAINPIIQDNLNLKILAVNRNMDYGSMLKRI